jgi:hypothetical protein
MGSHCEIGIPGGNRRVPRAAGTAQSIDSRGEDRSLCAVMREMVLPASGWLFFVIAMLLLLHGPRMI